MLASSTFGHAGLPLPARAGGGAASRKSRWACPVRRRATVPRPVARPASGSAPVSAAVTQRTPRGSGPVCEPTCMATTLMIYQVVEARRGVRSVRGVIVDEGGAARGRHGESRERLLRGAAGRRLAWSRALAEGPIRVCGRRADEDRDVRPTVRAVLAVHGPESAGTPACRSARHVSGPPAPPRSRATAAPNGGRRREACVSGWGASPRGADEARVRPACAVLLPGHAVRRTRHLAAARHRPARSARGGRRERLGAGVAASRGPARPRRARTP